MSENMRVSVILEMNGCLPYVAGTEGSAITKIMINPFLEILLYKQNICLLQRYL
jgi:hypothetical protein